MKYQFEIIEKIKQAMTRSCRDMLEFTDEPSREFNAEYLFTVNAVKSINELNGPDADPFKIYLERSTKTFAQDCIHPVKWGKFKVTPTIFRRKIPNINRPGRVDIAIYYDKPMSRYFGTQPLCAIEIKGFNPQRKVVIEDLKRNLELLRASGETGNSVLQFTIFSALHSFKNFDSPNVENTNLNFVKTRYLKWFSELGALNDVTYQLDVSTISKDLNGRTIEHHEDDIEVDLQSRHHFVGVTLIFSNNE